MATLHLEQPTSPGIAWAEMQGLAAFQSNLECSATMPIPPDDGVPPLREGQDGGEEDTRNVSLALSPSEGSPPQEGHQGGSRRASDSSAAAPPEPDPPAGPPLDGTDRGAAEGAPAAAEAAANSSSDSSSLQGESVENSQRAPEGSGGAASSHSSIELGSVRSLEPGTDPPEDRDTPQPQPPPTQLGGGAPQPRQGGGAGLPQPQPPPSRDSEGTPQPQPPPTQHAPPPRQQQQQQQQQQVGEFSILPLPPQQQPVEGLSPAGPGQGAEAESLEGTARGKLTTPRSMKPQWPEEPQQGQLAAPPQCELPKGLRPAEDVWRERERQWRPPPARAVSRQEMPPSCDRTTSRNMQNVKPRVHEWEAQQQQKLRAAEAAQQIPPAESTGLNQRPKFVTTPKRHGVSTVDRRKPTFPDPPPAPETGRATPPTRRPASTPPRLTRSDELRAAALRGKVPQSGLTGPHAAPVPPLALRPFSARRVHSPPPSCAYPAPRHSSPMSARSAAGSGRATTPRRSAHTAGGAPRPDRGSDSVHQLRAENARLLRALDTMRREKADWEKAQIQLCTKINDMREEQRRQQPQQWRRCMYRDPAPAALPSPLASPESPLAGDAPPTEDPCAPPAAAPADGTPPQLHRGADAPAAAPQREAAPAGHQATAPPALRRGPGSLWEPRAAATAADAGLPVPEPSLLR
eukprot:TRINITY_DN14857_c4_g2_i1.p1 TRINITY_DN14857_c4_g2~~TRINITY_DN14857_c4_g2_i1.p1  ORF type:complete len:688 (+),score=141.60 TRINITY_DN14857_c4_g2_i1:62-2125(+)